MLSIVLAYGDAIAHHLSIQELIHVGGYDVFMTDSFRLFSGRSISQISEEKNHLLLKTLLSAKESDGRISVTEVDIDGAHQSLETKSELRTYYIINGSLEFSINGVKEIKVVQGDILTLEKNSQYSLEGSAKYLVINTPAFKDGDDVYL